MSEGTEYVNDGITDLPDKLADWLFRKHNHVPLFLFEDTYS